MRRAARTDDNQKEIVSFLREKGYAVLSLASMGKGVPDLLVSDSTKNVLFEVKDGRKSKSQQKLTEDEEAFHRNWPGPLYVIRNVYDAMKAME